MERKNPLQEWNITLIMGWKIIGTNMAPEYTGKFPVFSNSMELPSTQKKKKRKKKKKERKEKDFEKKSNWRKK